MDTFEIYLPLIILAAVIWTIPWKAVALWKAARNGSKIWFIALLLINTMALLEILYIFVISKKEAQRQGLASLQESQS